VGPYCFVLIAGLCFSGHSVKADVHQMGMMSAVEVTAQGYVVSTSITDVIDMHDFRKSPSACQDGICIRYHKHCADDAGKIGCIYRVVWPGIAPDGVIHVTADSAAALDTAEREVALRVDRDGKAALLPFTLFSERAGADAPPDCTDDFKACAGP